MAIRETDLYGPVKRLLESQGYAVKGEIGDVDVVATRDGDSLVAVELKTGFTLSLVHQAVARLSLTETVYAAVPAPRGRRALAAMRANRTLCRRLGIGLILVNVERGIAFADLDPGPYQPRQSKARKARLLKEFAHLSGDPNTGGADRRGPRMTAYRQDAAALLVSLSGKAEMKAAELAAITGISRARAILADNHYGWFERIRTGYYRLSAKGDADCAVLSDSASGRPDAPRSAPSDQLQD